MKVIDLVRHSLTLQDLLELAGEDNIVLRAPDGRQFVLAEINDFAEEIEKVGQNQQLMELLNDRSMEAAKYSLGQVREQLRGRPRGPSKQGRSRKENPKSTPAASGARRNKKR
jgi:hypothetical protein